MHRNELIVVMFVMIGAKVLAMHVGVMLIMIVNGCFRPGSPDLAPHPDQPNTWGMRGRLSTTVSSAPPCVARAGNSSSRHVTNSHLPSLAFTLTFTCCNSCLHLPSLSSSLIFTLTFTYFYSHLHLLSLSPSLIFTLTFT